MMLGWGEHGGKCGEKQSSIFESHLALAGQIDR